MKLCLVAVNSKYVHTGLAVDSLRAFAESGGIRAETRSYTINQPAGQILGDLFRTRADGFFFSVYIWNCETVYRLSRELHQILPEAEIWYGGPEVSFRSTELLKDHPEARGIMRGEGEESFAEIAGKAYGGEKAELNQLKGIRGITYRLPGSGPEECIRENPDRAPMNMDDLVFPYSGTADPNRIYYYESSRGCPFGCTYCLSSIDKSLRFKTMAKVERELDWFLEQRVKQVKFTDRTFNVSAGDGSSRALSVWRYLKEKDNGVTNFHFEICAELLTGEELEFLKTLRPGQVQFEIGVQTVNPETLAAIRRGRNAAKLEENVARLLEGRNIHIHLDLIAGLPYENAESFRNSFNEVYRMRPLQLQLGFLKVLKGTAMEETAKRQGYIYQSEPPYEVLETPWISYEELLVLKGAEEMTEVYLNSHQFERSLAELEKDGVLCGIPGGAFGLFEQLADFYRKNGYDRMDHSRMDRYRILLEFIEALGLDREKYIPLLLTDALARERLKHWPEWAGKREKPAVFDYETRDPLTGNAAECFRPIRDCSPRQTQSAEVTVLIGRK